MSLDKTNFWISLVLVIYLLFIGVGAATMVIFNFPTEEEGKIIFSQNEAKELSFFPFGTISSIDQGFLLLAFLAGIAGSFLHAAHSLSTYLGNSSFKPSWTTWYFLRPWIGGVLGFAIYLTFRAGLVSGASAANPYGVVALGLLGGWFSKTTTDKLQEVFETLFKTDADKQRKDKLQSANQPVIEDIKPSPVPSTDDEITISGHDFQEGAVVIIDGQEIQAKFVSDTELKVSLENLAPRPTGGAQVQIKVKNPEGNEPLSKESPLVFD